MLGEQARQRSAVLHIAGCERQAGLLAALARISADRDHAGALCAEQLCRGQPNSRCAAEDHRLLSGKRCSFCCGITVRAAEGACCGAGAEQRPGKRDGEPAQHAPTAGSVRPTANICMSLRAGFLGQGAQKSHPAVTHNTCTWQARRDSALRAADAITNERTRKPAKRRAGRHTEPGVTCSRTAPGSRGTRPAIVAAPSLCPLSPRRRAACAPTPAVPMRAARVRGTHSRSGASVAGPGGVCGAQIGAPRSSGLGCCAACRRGGSDRARVARGARRGRAAAAPPWAARARRP